ncbi:MAG TPA: hypothetical protein VD978_33525 [Azospirillum sp.]|nr:hypothetical protein [Azospirillum sp.]
MDEIELRTELAMLKGQVEGLRWLVKGLVLALNRAGAIDLQKVCETFAVVSTYVEHTETSVATLPLRSSIFFLDALAKSPESDPLQAMITSALLHADVGSEQKNALQTWLSQATEDEIAQELEQLFSRFLRRPDQGGNPGA